MSGFRQSLVCIVSPGNVQVDPDEGEDYQVSIFKAPVLVPKEVDSPRWSDPVIALSIAASEWAMTSPLSSTWSRRICRTPARASSSKTDISEMRPIRAFLGPDALWIPLFSLAVLDMVAVSGSPSGSDTCGILT